MSKPVCSYTGIVFCSCVLRIVRLSEGWRTLIWRPNRESNPADKDDSEWGYAEEIGAAKSI